MANTKEISNDKLKIDKKKNQKRKYRKYAALMWLAFIGAFLGLVLLFVGVANGMFGELPSFVELESPKSALATEVYSSDSLLMGKFFTVDRSNATYEEIPKHVREALVATEDARYYDHSGIDFRSLARVFFKTALLGQDAGGGSTITQQLAKNLLHKRANSLIERIKQKLQEWVIAVKLERSYTKNEILSMYLNTANFGYLTQGIKSASRRYFNKEPEQLAIEEGAVLVGMLKGPSMFNPRRNPERSRNRRNVVFSQMDKYGYLEPTLRDSIKELPIDLDFVQTSHNEGIATYFREHLRSEAKKWSNNNIKVDGSNYNIHQDGLKIYTTIDYRLQKYAEEAMAEHMPVLQGQFDSHWKNKDPWHNQKNIENISGSKVRKGSPWYGTNSFMYRAITNKNTHRYWNLRDNGKSEKEIKANFEKKAKMRVFTWQGEKDTLMTPVDSIRHYKRLLHTGFMVMDPKTGHVKAWVGGINQKHFQYDNVRPSSKRQVGSTFKPFVYTVAVQNAFSPCMKVPNLPVVFEEFDNWSPRNAGRIYDGEMVTLQTGLAHSINRITAYLMKKISAEEVVEMAQRMGIESHMDPYPSICLGTPDISVYEMVGAYSTFANKGFYAKPSIMTKIEDKNGAIIQEFPTVTKEVISEKTAYAMLSLLRGVTERGTAIRLRSKYKMYNEIAGKTGTTNDNSDGWYIGMTPGLIAGAWVGGDEKIIRFRSTRLGCGANMALPVWATFMDKVYKDKELCAELGISQDDRFPLPVGMDIELNCSKYEDPKKDEPNVLAGETEGGAVGGEDDSDDYNDQFDDNE
ncbi:MAG: transglycosylase domain-containing protein [Chitinophagales bacterium]